MVPKLQQLGILFLSIEKKYCIRTNLYAFGKADAGSFDTAFMELYFMKKNIQLVITSGFLSQLTKLVIGLVRLESLKPGFVDSRFESLSLEMILLQN